MMLLMIKMREEKISDYIDNLLSVKIRNNLYDISPNTKSNNYNEPTQKWVGSFVVILGFHYENECDGSNYVIN